MSNVVKFPKPKKRHKQVVSVREMYCQSNAFPDQMVWDMCTYTKNDREPCQECSRWERDPDYGQIMRGCYAHAMEACRFGLAWAERLKHKGPYK